jgi:hypothetical protein
MTRLVLTIDQARDLQQSVGAWPNGWHFLLTIEAPEKPDTLADPERMAAALTMTQRGCGEDQIAEQLGWLRSSAPFRQLTRLQKRMNKAN